MGLFRISGPVRRQMGREAETLDAGVGLLAEVQCWQCGELINMFAVRPGQVALSCVAVAPLVNMAVFGHAAHAPSQVFTGEQFQAAATDKPFTGAGGEQRLLVDGRPAEEVVEITGVGPGAAERSQAWLDLAAKVEAAPDDESARRIFEQATGTPADPRGEWARRAEQAQAASARPLIWCVRCPVCGQLPDLVLSAEQAFCGNDDCSALQFAPGMTAPEQLASGTQLPPLVGPGGIPQEVADYFAGLRPRQVPGSAADDVREKEIREFFHLRGYRCADGRCIDCGPLPAPQG